MYNSALKFAEIKAKIDSFLYTQYPKATESRLTDDLVYSIYEGNTLIHIFDVEYNEDTDKLTYSVV